MWLPWNGLNVRLLPIERPDYWPHDPTSLAAGLLMTLLQAYGRGRNRHVSGKLRAVKILGIIRA